MIDIKITKSEFVAVSQVGALRHVAVWGKIKSEEAINEGFAPDIVGCLGEFAICKYLNAFWVPGVGRYDKNDIPGFSRPIDIKTRFRGPFTPDLALIANSNSHNQYIDKNFDLVFCNYTFLNIQVLGYITAEEYFKKAELKPLKKGRGPCWQLPIKDLRPFEELVLMPEKRELLK